jgi:hypothetical protein
VSLAGFGVALLLTFFQLGGVKLPSAVLLLGYIVSAVMIVVGLADAGLESKTGRSFLGSTERGGKLRLEGVSARFSPLPDRTDLARFQPVLQLRNRTRKPLEWQLTEYRTAVNPSSHAGSHAGPDFAGKIERHASGEVPMPTLDVPVGIASAEIGFAVEYGPLGEHREYGTKADLHVALRRHTGTDYPSVVRWNVLRKRDWKLG